MAAKKAPAKKMPAKKVSSAADFRKKEEADKKKMTPGAGTSKPLKSGAGYLKPASLSGTKRVSKSSGGDLASERGVVRQAAQRNRGFRKGAEETGLSFGLINMTYRDSDGKLKNSVMNRKRFTEFPKKDVLFMGDASKKQPKPKKK
jgi:hypothetical protein